MGGLANDRPGVRSFPPGLTESRSKPREHAHQRCVDRGSFGEQVEIPKQRIPGGKGGPRATVGTRCLLQCQKPVSVGDLPRRERIETSGEPDSHAVHRSQGVRTVQMGCAVTGQACEETRRWWWFRGPDFRSLGEDRGDEELQAPSQVLQSGSLFRDPRHPSGP